jgi:hypothetical protein
LKGPCRWRSSPQWRCGPLPWPEIPAVCIESTVSRSQPQLSFADGTSAALICLGI